MTNKISPFQLSNSLTAKVIKSNRPKMNRKYSYQIKVAFKIIKVAY